MMTSTEAQIHSLPGYLPQYPGAPAQQSSILPIIQLLPLPFPPNNFQTGAVFTPPNAPANQQQRREEKLAPQQTSEHQTSEKTEQKPPQK